MACKAKDAACNNKGSEGPMIKVNDVPALCQKHCKIKSRENLESLLRVFIKDGPRHVQVITDFDHTLTKQHMPDGKDVLSTFAIFDDCPSVPPRVADEIKRLREYYIPIESDPTIPFEQKKQHMFDWWDKVAAIMVGFPFNLADLEKNAAKYKDSFRDNCNGLFAKLNGLCIPLLIVSAGIGECVTGLLKAANFMCPLVKVCSNFISIKNGMINSFVESPTINVYNKNQKITKYYDEGYSKLTCNRRHVLLMGDNLADADMVDAVKEAAFTIKIGFLYHHVEDNLKDYLNKFDIVLIDDQTMDVPLAIVKLIEANKKNCK